MTPGRSSPARNARRAVRAWAALAVATALLAGCALGPAAEPVPAELPFETHDQGVVLRWALDRGPAAVRATGVATTWMDQELHLTLGLFGLDGAGRIVSRGFSDVHSGFARGPLPFTVRLRPTGQEARYELRVVGMVTRPTRG